MFYTNILFVCFIVCLYDTETDIICLFIYYWHLGVCLFYTDTDNICLFYTDTDIVCLFDTDADIVCWFI